MMMRVSALLLLAAGANAIQGGVRGGPDYAKIALKDKEEAAKIVGDADADLVRDRPTTAPPGHTEKMEYTGHYKDVAPLPKEANEKGMDPVTSMKVDGLSPLLRFKNKENYAGDWGAEYGPKSKYKGIHGPYQPMPQPSAAEGRSAAVGTLLLGSLAALALLRL